MLCFKLEAYFIIIHLFKSFVAIQQNEYFEDASFVDHVCNQNDTLYERNNITKVKCGLLCEREQHRCFGFTYRTADRKCVLCRGSHAGMVAMVTGMKYYVPKRRMLGQTCSPDFPCTEGNQQCIDGVCTCTPGYSFQEVTWSCVPGCETYGSTFQGYVGYRIWANNFRQKRGITLAACIDACIASTGPVCVSFDFTYSYQGDTLCNLASVTALDVPTAFQSVSNWEYHHRNC